MGSDRVRQLYEKLTVLRLAHDASLDRHDEPEYTEHVRAVLAGAGIQNI